MPMSPGTYLTKRRTMAGLSPKAAAVALLELQILAEPVSGSRIGKLELRLAGAEADQDHFTRGEVEILRNVFRLDANVYEQLVDLHLSGPGSALPEPQLCRSCACSFFDPCFGDDGPCAWHTHDLCTVCAPGGAAAHIHRRRPFVIVASEGRADSAEAS